MPRSASPFYVPKDKVPEILEEISVRAEAKKRTTARRFNPALGASAEEADETIARMQRDIGAYGEYVYGHKPARVHQFWNDRVDDVIHRRVRQNKILILAPPNSAKSTWNSLIRTTHYLGNHPDQHLIFLTSSDDMAKTFASTVRMTLDASERHREVFSDSSCRPYKSRGWSGDGLYLRGTPLGDKDPAYKAVGWGMTIMGARANGIILDDVLDQKTAESESEQRKAQSYYDKTIVPRLNTHSGWLLAVMTRFAEGDLGGHFLKLAETSGDWLVYKTPLEADENDPMGRRPGESLWPEQFPPEFIRATRRRLSLAEYNLVYNCLDYESPVRLTSRINRIYRRWYEGPHVEIVTASGKKLAGTPNHPILTPQGWVRLGSLQEGDDVVRRSAVDVAGSGREHVDRGDPQIGEIFRFAANSRKVKLGTASQVDFHGDVSHPEIDVVDIDGLLHDRIVAQFPQIQGQSLLGLSDGDLTSLASTGTSDALASGLTRSVDLAMSRTYTTHIGVRTLLHDPAKGRVTLTSERDAEFLQLEADRRRRNSVPSSDLREGGPILVTTDKIVQVVHDPTWSGHVFNLETEDHRYESDGIITHNCDPTGIGGDIFTNESYFQDLPPNFWTDIEPTCFIGQAVDLAFSASKRACFTVILTYAVDPQYRMYVLHVDRAHYAIKDAEERLKDLIRWTKPLVTTVETEDFHDATIRSMVKRIISEIAANIQLERPRGDKIMRARLPAGFAEHHRIFVDQSAPWYRSFMTEILGFPRMRFKDQVDALSLAALTVQNMEDALQRFRGKQRTVETTMSA